MYNVRSFLKEEKEPFLFYSISNWVAVYRCWCSVCYGPLGGIVLLAVLILHPSSHSHLFVLTYSLMGNIIIMREKW